MLSSFEQILEEIRRVGLAENENFEKLIGHPVITGDMYEGLTVELVKGALFEPFDLHIRSGKIRNKAGEISKQIDCMLVAGDSGIPIPHTRHHLCDMKDVIAVIEVKKTLNRKTLSDGFDNLINVATLSRDAMEITDGQRVHRMHADAMRALTGTAWTEQPPTDQPWNFAYVMTGADAVCPLTVVWGYQGHNTEAGFRDAIQDKVTKLPFWDLFSIPSLVINGDLSFVKSNGMPYANRGFFQKIATEQRVLVNGRRFQKGDPPSAWDFGYTQQGLALHNFLNLLWYRLCKWYKRDFTLLTNGRNYTFNPLFALVRNRRGKQSILAVMPLSAAQLQTNEVPGRFPEPISIEEIAATRAIKAVGGLIDAANSEQLAAQLGPYVEWALERAALVGLTNPLRLTYSDASELSAALRKSRFVSFDGDKLKLSTSRCVIICTKNGLTAGDNYDGRLSLSELDQIRGLIGTRPRDPSDDYEAFGWYDLEGGAGGTTPP